jgi:hypothetical protein
MARPAEEHIPADVMAAARRGGLEDPIWYVGRSNGHEGIQVEQSLDELVRQAEAAGEQGSQDEKI